MMNLLDLVHEDAVMRNRAVLALNTGLFLAQMTALPIDYLKALRKDPKVSALISEARRGLSVETAEALRTEYTWSGRLLRATFSVDERVMLVLRSGGTQDGDPIRFELSLAQLWPVPLLCEMAELKFSTHDLHLLLSGGQLILSSETVQERIATSPEVEDFWLAFERAAGWC